MNWEAFTEDHNGGWWAIRDVESNKEVGSGTGGFKEADARLMAAAPALLEALEGLMLTFEATLSYGDPTEFNSYIVAQAAVKLAKGEE